MPKIPVVLLDRAIDTKDDSLYLTAVTSDTVYEGKVAGEWLAKETGGKMQHRRAPGNRRVQPRHQPQEGLRRGRGRQSGHEDRPHAIR